MSNMQEISLKYSGSLTIDQSEELYGILQSIKPSELDTIDDHKMYIELLAILRQSIRRVSALNGVKFLETLESLLSVGEDGVYSNRLRFLYELIQNVDDCEYDSIEDCRLNIQFRYDQQPGQIIFTYNEKGFTPENVFSITGIAEKSKNISADKIEIGEKGIGFKSVFGIAEKVRIQSGKFSFELLRDSFTVPVPSYQNYAPIKGTRLVLEMSAQNCRNIYNDLVKQYSKPSALLNKNPILFLVKLTNLRICGEEDDYLEFIVQRTEPDKQNDLIIEKNVRIAIDVQTSQNGKKNQNRSEVLCYRYTLPIVYGKTECQERYGTDTPFEKRRHHLIAVFPVVEEKKYKGILYSFFPTQIRMTVPMILHVPFKLNGSREYVDSQNNNAWFTNTVLRLSSFLRRVYSDLAQTVKQEIVRYLPPKDSFLFEDNEKDQCLLSSDFLSSRICQERIFFTTNGIYESIGNIVAFGKNEEIDDPEYVFSLLGESGYLFVPPYAVDMRVFGCKTIEKVEEKLFERGLAAPKSLGPILDYLEKMNDQIDYTVLLDKQGGMILKQDFIDVLVSHKKLSDAYLKKAKKSIKISPQASLRLYLDKSLNAFDPSYTAELQNLVKSSDLNPGFVAYLRKISYKVYTVECDKDFVFAAENGIVLTRGREDSSFSMLVSNDFDPRHTFTSSLRLKQAMRELEQIDGSCSNAEYLKKLRAARRSLKIAYGDKFYDNLLQLIKKAGEDKNRFLSELIQNSDDCKYALNVLPSFSVKLKDRTTLIVTSNELGFTQANVRAITAIGESTKKALDSGNTQQIGEKGVGFKSVFNVAKSVEIHSNGFDFILTDKTPTIPDKCSAIDNAEGTTLIFNLKEKNIQETFTLERILHLCICLRNLKKLCIDGHTVEIRDEDCRRRIILDDKTYTFERFVYSFEIKDDEILQERRQNAREIDRIQKIVIYLPEQNKVQKYPVYSGLPLKITSNVPLIFDAPFELTTSRETIVQNKWNDCICAHIYEAMDAFLQKKQNCGLDILRYVGLKAQAKTVSFHLFENERYLNQYSYKLLGILKRTAFLPILGETRTVAIQNRSCYLLPDYIAKLPPEIVHTGFPKTIINTIGKSQYIPALEALGCKSVTDSEIFRFLQKHIGDLMNNDVFRTGFYADLLKKENIDLMVQTLPIFPVRQKTGTIFIPFNQNIYTHTSKVSSDNYYILETDIMSLNIADHILGRYHRINSLTQEVLDAKYQNTVKSVIRNVNNELSQKQIAEYLRNEFENNREQFRKCREMLFGLRAEIPLLMKNGSYKTGNKFLDSGNHWFVGKLIPSLIVDESFVKLARFLELQEIGRIHFDDIDITVDELSSDDIDDLKIDFVFYYEIIRGFIETGCISDEQITRNNLEFGIGNMDDDDDPDEEFPEKRIPNLRSLREYIKKQWNQNRNPYTEKKYIKWQPTRPIDKTGYTMAEYASKYNKNKCFCQMCKNLYYNKYIERNEIERNPAFAWKQMYLSLCLTCSKDYVFLRYNDVIWSQFIKTLMSTDVSTAGSFEIPIGDQTITFTAIHLAEVQEIFKNQGWGNNAPTRKPKLGSSVEDEE